MDPKRTIIVKMPKVKDKERILKAASKKQRISNKGVPIRLSAGFSKETSQARRDWQEMKIRGLEPRLLYPANIFRIKVQINSFPDKKKPKEFIITKPLLYEMEKEDQNYEQENGKNTYLSTIESKKQTKQRRTETESWIWRVF